MTTNNSQEVQLSVPATCRNSRMDVFKGLAILSMVLAHCGFPLGQEIYLFHMAAFFMASGYFYNSKNSETILSVLKYCLKKVLALYIPYVICNGLLILLHNQLITWKLLTCDSTFLEIGGFGAVWGLQWPYDPQFKHDSLMMVLRFMKEPQLGGATWFLRALFCVSVFHCIFMYVVNKLRFPVLKKAVMGAAVIACCLLAVGVQNKQFPLSDAHASYFAGWLAYLLGIGIRKKEHLLRYDLQSGFLAAVALYILNKHGSVSLASGYIENLPFYIIASLLGWILLRSISEHLSGPVEKALAYAGKHSMSIVFLHFISFKVVTLAVILLTNSPMVLLASFPQLDIDIPHLWVAYTAAGMVIPLSLNAVYQIIKRYIIQFTRGVYESIRNRCGRPAGP